MAKLKIFIKFKIKEGHVKDYLAAKREMVQKSQAEEGCISYTLNTVKDQPNVVALLEIWQDEEALELHKNSEHFKTLLPLGKELVEGVLSADTFTEYEL